MLLPKHKENKPLNFQYVGHGNQVGKNSDRMGRNKDGMVTDRLNFFTPKLHSGITFLLVGRIRARWDKSTLAPFALRISRAFNGLGQTRKKIVN